MKWYTLKCFIKQWKILRIARMNRRCTCVCTFQSLKCFWHKRWCWIWYIWW